MRMRELYNIDALNEWIESQEIYKRIDCTIIEI